MRWKKVVREYMKERKGKELAGRSKDGGIGDLSVTATWDNSDMLPGYTHRDICINPIWQATNTTFSRRKKNKRKKGKVRSDKRQWRETLI